MRRWPLALPLAVFLVDRLSKSFIEGHVAEWESIAVIPGFFQIVHARNTGIAFSFFAEQGSGRGAPALLALTAALTAAVALMLWTSCRRQGEHWTLAAALGLITGGAAGNFFDRAAYGSVTDFLDFYWRAWHYPAFNAADSAITCGAALLLVHLWLTRGRPKPS